MQPSLETFNLIFSKVLKQDEHIVPFSYVYFTVTCTCREANLQNVKLQRDIHVLQSRRIPPETPSNIVKRQGTRAIHSKSVISYCFLVFIWGCRQYDC